MLDGEMGDLRFTRTWLSPSLGSTCSDNLRDARPSVPATVHCDVAFGIDSAIVWMCNAFIYQFQLLIRCQLRTAFRPGPLAIILYLSRGCWGISLGFVRSSSRGDPWSSLDRIILYCGIEYKTRSPGLVCMACVALAFQRVARTVAE